MSERAKMTGIRFCRVLDGEKAKKLAEMLGSKGLGLTELDMSMPDGGDGQSGAGNEGFQGAVFPLDGQEGDEGASGPSRTSWIEIWPTGEQMPDMTMLQIVVDDADKLAAQARQNGLDTKGPDDAHGERIYYLEGPGGLPIAFLSKKSD